MSQSLWKNCKNVLVVVVVWTSSLDSFGYNSNSTRSFLVIYPYSAHIKVIKDAVTTKPCWFSVRTFGEIGKTGVLEEHFAFTRRNDCHVAGALCLELLFSSLFACIKSKQHVHRMWCILKPPRVSSDIYGYNWECCIVSSATLRSRFTFCLCFNVAFFGSGMVMVRPINKRK